MSRGRKKGSKSIRAGGQETVGVICNRYAFICCMVNTKIFKEKKNERLINSWSFSVANLSPKVNYGEV